MPLPASTSSECAQRWASATAMSVPHEYRPWRGPHHREPSAEFTYSRPMADATLTPTTGGGRLMHLLASRGGTASGEPTMVLQHREALIWTLGKAAALEQLVMCQYLYAAFSLKDRDDEGLSAPQLEATRRWRRELMHIAEQEMLHLALVQNLL